MRFVPLALAVGVAVLVVPVLTGNASAPAASAPVASSFDAATITTLAANGVEQVAAPGAAGPGATDLDAGDAADVASDEFGGDVRAAVLGPFTDQTAGLTRGLAWQVLVEDTALPSGERGRAWIAVDAATGEVLAAKPLLELDAS